MSRYAALSDTDLAAYTHLRSLSPRSSNAGNISALLAQDEVGRAEVAAWRDEARALYGGVGMGILGPKGSVARTRVEEKLAVREWADEVQEEVDAEAEAKDGEGTVEGLRVVAGDGEWDAYVGSMPVFPMAGLTPDSIALASSAAAASDDGGSGDGDAGSKDVEVRNGQMGEGAGAEMSVLSGAVNQTRKGGKGRSGAQQKRTKKVKKAEAAAGFSSGSVAASTAFDKTVVEDPKPTAFKTEEVVDSPASCQSAVPAPDIAHDKTVKTPLENPKFLDSFTTKTNPATTNVAEPKDPQSLATTKPIEDSATPAEPGSANDAIPNPNDHGSRSDPTDAAIHEPKLPQNAFHSTANEPVSIKNTVTPVTSNDLATKGDKTVASELTLPHKKRNRTKAQRKTSQENAATTTTAEGIFTTTPMSDEDGPVQIEEEQTQRIQEARVPAPKKKKNRPSSAQRRRAKARDDCTASVGDQFVSHVPVAPAALAPGLGVQIGRFRVPCFVVLAGFVAQIVVVAGGVYLLM